MKSGLLPSSSTQQNSQNISSVSIFPGNIILWFCFSIRPVTFVSAWAHIICRYYNTSLFYISFHTHATRRSVTVIRIKNNIIIRAIRAMHLFNESFYKYPMSHSWIIMLYNNKYILCIIYVYINVSAASRYDNYSCERFFNVLQTDCLISSLFIRFF